MGSPFHARKRVRHQGSAMTSSVSPSLLPNIPESSVPISVPSRQMVVGRHSVHGRGRRRHVIIDIPDDVLLEIFNVYTDETPRGWPTLVHICRQWRSVVFASTHRLNLQLWCTFKTPVRKMLDIWPALPIIIQEHNPIIPRSEDADNIVAALGNPDRVRCIDLRAAQKFDLLDRFAAAMKEPFPELTALDLRTRIGDTVFIPDSFLGGSAPRLQTVWFDGFSFPAIPKLLSSTSYLVHLGLYNIPHSGYISPEAMVTCLSTLTRLERFSIGFRSPRSRPDQPSPPRSIRTVLPALSHLGFRGVSEYLEDLTSRIDAPLLRALNIGLFNQLIFSTPRLCSFISRAERLRSQSQARMKLSADAIQFSHMTAGRPWFNLMILCKASDWQLSSLTQFCDSPVLSFFNLERLDICGDPYVRLDWQEDVEDIQWLELLRLFTTVKRLSLSNGFAPRVVPALQELSGERIMDVLPALQSIFLPETSLSGPVKEAFAQFLTARHLSGHPVAVNP
ncbi:hypothetical protein BC826DRAFT_1106279 [Russula brevipes]|nr:hypothetical protein BC826DRAFT_1106279 [Russula brevipes]